MKDALEKFRRLPPEGQAAIIGLTAWNLTLSVLAQRDLAGRPAKKVRGPKWLWALANLTNTVGPLCYFHWGRR
jgi:hypothetical protein